LSVDESTEVDEEEADEEDEQQQEEDDDDELAAVVEAVVAAASVCRTAASGVDSAKLTRATELRATCSTRLPLPCNLGEVAGGLDDCSGGGSSDLAALQRDVEVAAGGTGAAPR